MQSAARTPSTPFLMSLNFEIFNCRVLSRKSITGPIEILCLNTMHCTRNTINNRQNDNLNFVECSVPFVLGTQQSPPYTLQQASQLQQRYLVRTTECRQTVRPAAVLELEIISSTVSSHYDNLIILSHPDLSPLCYTLYYSS